MVEPKKQKASRRSGLTTKDVQKWVKTKYAEHPELQFVLTVGSITLVENDNPLDTSDDYGSETYWKPYRALIECLSGIHFPALYPETDKEKNETGLVIMQYEGLYLKRTMDRKGKNYDMRAFVVKQLCSNSSNAANGGSVKIGDVVYQDQIGELCKKASIATKKCFKEILSSIVVTAFAKVENVVKKNKTDSMIELTDYGGNLVSIRRHVVNNFSYAIIIQHVNTLINQICQEPLTSNMLVDWVCKASKIVLSKNNGSNPNLSSGLKQLLIDASTEIQKTNNERVMTCINREEKEKKMTSNTSHVSNFATTNQSEHNTIPDWMGEIVDNLGPDTRENIRYSNNDYPQNVTDLNGLYNNRSIGQTFEPIVGVGQTFESIVGDAGVFGTTCQYNFNSDHRGTAQSNISTGKNSRFLKVF